MLKSRMLYRLLKCSISYSWKCLFCCQWHTQRPRAHCAPISWKYTIHLSSILSLAHMFVCAFFFSLMKWYFLFLRIVSGILIMQTHFTNNIVNVDGVCFLCVHRLNRYFCAVIQGVYAWKCVENQELIIQCVCTFFSYNVHTHELKIVWSSHTFSTGRKMLILFFTSVIFASMGSCNAERILHCSKAFLNENIRSIIIKKELIIQLWSAEQREEKSCWFQCLISILWKFDSFFTFIMRYCFFMHLIHRIRCIRFPRSFFFSL